MSKGKKLKMIVTISITMMIMFYTPIFATSQIDAKGTELLSVIRSIGYWIILFMALKDIIKSAMDKSVKEVGTVITKYCLIYACLWLLPWLLRSMEGIV